VRARRRGIGKTVWVAFGVPNEYLGDDYAGKLMAAATSRRALARALTHFMMGGSWCPKSCYRLFRAVIVEEGA